MHFLGIGAQKAGTTWLWANLRPHPQLWLPPLKELHYFDRPDDGLWERLTGERRSYREARHALAAALRSPWRRSDDLAWHARYLLGRRSDSWYRSLFAPGRGRVTGEITPRYSLLDDAGIGHVLRVLPEVKIVYLLRDPVERAWSNLKDGVDRYGDPSRWTEPDVERFSRSDAARAGRYSEHLARWERAVGPERIHVGFFDRIGDDPAALLADVQRFLGVDDGPSQVPAAVRTAVHVGPAGSIPKELHRSLSALYRDELHALHARFANRYTRDWMERAAQA